MKLRSAFIFLTTAVLSSAALSLFNLIWIELNSPESLPATKGAFLGFGLFWAVCMPFVTLGGLVVGLPAHACLRRTGRCGWTDYLLAGLLGGALAAATLGSLLLMSPVAILPFAVFGGVAGICAALIWWTLIVKGVQREANHG